jgi:hypothetical protein
MLLNLNVEIREKKILHFEDITYCFEYDKFQLVNIKHG